MAAASASSPEASAAQKELMAKMKKIINTPELNANDAWREVWKQNVLPFDRGVSQPSLIDFVHSNAVELPRKGRAITPGCGRGYDALLFAQKGLESWGIDISGEAVEAAKIWLGGQPHAETARVFFKELDFFDFELPEGKFDLGYDYTFLCALNPSLRPKWADRFAELINPGGILLCLMFPLDGDRPGGPPFSLSPEIYAELLEENFELLHQEKPKNSSQGNIDREMMSAWKRR